MAGAARNRAQNAWKSASLGIGQNPVLDQAGPGSSFLSQSPERPG